MNREFFFRRTLATGEETHYEMRVITVAVIWALVVEVLLGLAFLAGCHWIGGWQAGLLLAGAALLIMALPWLGELTARYDSATGSVRARIGWWGRLALTGSPEPLLEVRVCGIPWRKKLGSKKSKETSPGEPSSESPTPSRPRIRPQINHENVDDITRAVTAALAAGNDLLWDAREVYFRIDAPAENSAYDDVIARVVGYRGVGPVDVKVTRGDGKRRIRARYRIGLFRAGATALCMAAQGRVWALRASRMEGPTSASAGGVNVAGGDDTPISDEELVREMAERMTKEGDDDGV